MPAFLRQLRQRKSLSGLTGWAAGFKDRGTSREGMAADIVVYDLEKLKSLLEEITYDLPAGEWRQVQKAEGKRKSNRE